MLRIVVSLVLSGTINLFACSSDFNCGFGQSCIKKPYKSNGICVDNVDRYGVRQYDAPKTDSIGPNTDYEGDCSFNSDCPIGFECNRAYKVCMKRH